VITSLVSALLPAAPVMAGEELSSVPDCSSLDEARVGETEVSTPWHAVLDADGVVVEHRMTLRRGREETTLRTGPRSLATAVADGRVLIGERSETGTTLMMVDTRQACVIWRRQLDQLVYDVAVPAGAHVLELSVHDRDTRWYQGTLVIDVEGGTTNAMIDGECSTSCQPNDGELDPAAFSPSVAARPVPAFAAGGWPPATTLAFRWGPGEVPPAWARPEIRVGADDASNTTLASSPRFTYRSGATDSIRYTPVFPSFCRYGIACATRDMPAWWSVWLRPHGTDFSWGTLLWCPIEPGSGCFDVRRVLLHELGHVMGLDHPSSEGFNLEADETVMHAITPARPSPGSGRHSYGRCDVATLQELYDVPTNSTPISTCNLVATRLTLAAGSTSLVAGSPVTLTARLRIADQDELGRLAGNVLNGRAVKLRYRPLGSSESWTSSPMSARNSGGAYVLEITPQESLELQAVFQAPLDEGLLRSTSSTVAIEVTDEQYEG
jgi:hypothetical protein